MSERACLGIGLRLLGLYLLISGISSIPDILWFIETKSESPAKSVQIFAVSWHVGLFVVFGYIFAFKSKVVAYLLGTSDKENLNNINLTVTQIIQLIGIFLIVSSIGPMVKGTVPLLDIGEIMAFDLGAILSPSVTILIGLVLCLRPELFNRVALTHRDNA